MLKRSEDPMGEREMILLMGAMLFFTMTTMSINRFCLNNSEVIMESEFIYYATSLAQGFIEEAKTRAFDVSVESGPATNPPYSFTYPLGPRYDEKYPYYTDVDDYNGLVLNVTANVNGPKVDYNVSVHVGYVEEWDINTVVTHKTYHKKMKVTVTSDYISTPVILSHVFSYFEY